MKASRSIDLSSIFKVTTREPFDWITPVCLALLATFGVFFIYSAQMASGRSQWQQQLVWLTAGAVVYTTVALLDYRLWLRWSHWVYLGSLLLLLVVLIPGIGQTRMGARRWLDFGLLSFQPSESAKLAVLIMTAATLTGAKIGTVRDSLQTLVNWLLRQVYPWC